MTSDCKNCICMKILLQMQFNLNKPGWSIRESVDAAIASETNPKIPKKTYYTATCMEIGCTEPIHYQITDKVRPLYCKTHIRGKEHRGYINIKRA